MSTEHGQKPQTWDWHENLAMTYARPGAHTNSPGAAFLEGVRTVFDMLRREFPEAHVCKAAANPRPTLSDSARWTLACLWLKDRYFPHGMPDDGADNLGLMLRSLGVTLEQVERQIDSVFVGVPDDAGQ